MKKLWEKLDNTYIGDTFISWGFVLVNAVTILVTILLSIKFNNVRINKKN